MLAASFGGQAPAHARRFRGPVWAGVAMGSDEVKGGRGAKLPNRWLISDRCAMPGKHAGCMQTGPQYCELELTRKFCRDQQNPQAELDLFWASEGHLQCPVWNRSWGSQYHRIHCPCSSWEHSQSMPNIPQLQPVKYSPSLRAITSITPELDHPPGYHPPSATIPGCHRAFDRLSGLVETSASLWRGPPAGWHRKMIGWGSTPCHRRDIRKWCSWGGQKPMVTVTSDISGCWMLVVLDVASLELPLRPRSNVGKSSLINSLLHRTVQLSTDLVELFQARLHDGAHFQDFYTEGCCARLKDAGKDAR